VPPERLFLIENSIFDDVRLANRADRTALPLAPLERAVDPPAGPRIVYAGTFEPYQGVDLLVRAFAEVHRRRPDAELVLVGGRPDQGDAIRPLATRLGLGDACRLTGQVSKAVARRWLESAAILVSPRIQGSNTPLKIYEQLASGKPLVATSILSHTQVLTGEVCFLVEPDPDALAAGLRALSDPAESARRAGNARRLYEGAYPGPVRKQDAPLPRGVAVVCGIAAFTERLRPDSERLRAMCDTIRHRGPDDFGSRSRTG
jgi:glycosyltransferase involved in cell wall biosynthesis